MSLRDAFKNFRRKHLHADDDNLMPLQYKRRTAAESELPAVRCGVLDDDGEDGDEETETASEEDITALRLECKKRKQQRNILLSS